MKSLMIFTKPLVEVQIGQWELTYLLARGMVAFGRCFVLSCVLQRRSWLIIRSTQPLQAARKQTLRKKACLLGRHQKTYTQTHKVRVHGKN